MAFVPNGTDLEEFRPGNSIRGQFGLPEGVPLFLFAGDIRTTRKNLDTVLRAMVSVENCLLVVAGRLEGSPFPLLARELGVADRVRFLGMIGDMPGLMRSVDAFVFPSRYEAMSLVLLEAMAAGLPVITANSAGGAEIIADGGRILDDPEDFKSLAVLMNELVLDENLRRGLGTRARAIAEDYSWRRMATRYLELYESLVTFKEIP
jgi:glycosyltransferase involved in cell wall biosynthesis